ncbi:hypothetical protein JMJ35_008994 [Cladonia borealis]|uniref:Uncharacterized protein n=1 Tax=Cladonia borealis TaxID=184061 RepID=A0AA39QVZ1_9LECA|nr:hypothetical protein JMJ35_008994 [Cladonia borealis]
MQAMTRWDPDEKLTLNEQLSVKIANRLLATKHNFPDPKTQAVFAKETEDITTSDAFLRHWRTGYLGWKGSWNDEWVSSEGMTALEDLMLTPGLLLYYQCAKAVLDEAFNYAPHNEAPDLAQPSPEEAEESSEEIASPEWRDEDYDDDATPFSLAQIRNWAV